MRTIDIDLDVHKVIEQGRRDFGETDNDILRRLLLGPAERPQAASAGRRPWSAQGVTLSHGTEAAAEYNGQRVTATIEDGRWVVNGRRYGGPSPALQENVTTRSGKKTNLNGWTYWSVRRPGETGWISLNALRGSTADLGH